MKILMLKDVPVYDVEQGVVLDKKRCPFIDETGYETWNKNRYYLTTNRTAKQIILRAGGEEGIEAKRRLSLSDGYWISLYTGAI